VKPASWPNKNFEGPHHENRRTPANAVDGVVGGCLLCGCEFVGSWVIVQTLLAWKQDDGKEVFAEKHEFNLMLLMLLPTAAFTAAIFVLGIYVASLIFIAAFMVWQGKYSYIKSIVVGTGISAALFVLFEVWFMLPLPKGFIHAWLGY